MPPASLIRRVEHLGKKYEGKYAAIETSSRRFFVGDTFDDAVRTARKTFPRGVFLVLRIGRPAALFTQRASTS